MQTAVYNLAEVKRQNYEKIAPAQTRDIHNKKDTFKSKYLQS
ncbi:hypothetical protein [Nostoc spongiaeforme]|nr:hypothetical protein [Nostoc spongiaeforme]